MDDVTLSPFSPGALEEFQQKREQKEVAAWKLKRGVCACGHSMNFHKTLGGGDVVCTPAQIGCSCREARPVLTAKNLRNFMHATDGACYGVDHALAKGILSCMANGVEYAWIGSSGLDSEVACNRCEEITGMPIPVAIDRGTGRLTDDGKFRNHYNRIFCQSCFIELTTSGEASE